MSQETSNPNDEDTSDDQLTQLVSYLDGELDDTQTNAIEQSLINDPDMRSHADILSRTWALLDELEEVTAGQNFTQATVATISTETVDAPSSSSPRKRLSTLLSAMARYKVLPSLLIGVVGMAVGLFVGEQRQSQKLQSDESAAVDEVVLDNLDLLLKDDLYREIPDVQALQKLKLDLNAASEGNTTP